MKNPERKGELLAYSEITIWSLFPVLAVLSFNTIPSLVSLAWCSVLSALFFLLMIAFRRSWKDFRQPLLWKSALIGAVSINILFYGLYFVGLTMTSPGNGSIISLFEIFTSFLFFNIWKKEYITRGRMAGAFLMILGAIIVLLPTIGGINKGDYLILLATFFCPVGNYFAQKARTVASAESLMFLRSIIAVPFLFLLASSFGMHASLNDLQASWLPLFINGFVLFGFTKILWIEEIRYISVTKALALSSMGPLLTLLFAWILIGTSPTVWQLISFVPFAIGIMLLTGHVKVAPKNVN